MDYLRKKVRGNRFRTFTGFLTAKLRVFGFTREKFPSCIALLICPVITFYLFELYTHNPISSMNFKTQILNILFYQLTGFLLFGMFKYVRVALMIQSGFFMVIGLVNYYVLNFRSAPIMPWDIFSLKTASSVASNYSYALDWQTVVILLSFGILLIVESRFRMQTPIKKRKRLLLLFLPVVLLWAYTGMIQNDHFVRQFGLYDKLFTPTVMNKRDGNIVAFLMELEYLNVEKPEGYSAEELEKLYLQSQKDSEGLVESLANPEKTNRPNIIVIMDEAFSDLSVLGDFETNQDYMPFIHSLQNGAGNTATGYLNVSVLGGNTANTEFEFLTGSTMKFLPQGSVAYQQYLQNNMPSLASYLKELGYHTVAIHPYYPNGWDRSRVYPLMGFDSFLSKEDFAGAKQIRKYVSDEACFDKIIELYENKEKDEPLFVFNVTMQNHSGYDEKFTNFTPDVTVEGISSKSLPTYLSLMKETDRAFEKLTDYFREAEEDTIIVFFGDHQPTTYVSNPILRQNGVDTNQLTEEENLLRYKVPYVIWGNFDIKEQKNGETSVNYLMIDVLENCGLPLPALQSSLKELRKEYPVISALQVRDKNGELLEKEDAEAVLSEYQSLEYYLLFDYRETEDGE